MVVPKNFLSSSRLLAYPDLIKTRSGRRSSEKHLRNLLTKFPMHFRAQPGLPERMIPSINHKNIRKQELTSFKLQTAILIEHEQRQGATDRLDLRLDKPLLDLIFDIDNEIHIRDLHLRKHGVQELLILIDPPSREIAVIHIAHDIDFVVQDCVAGRFDVVEGVETFALFEDLGHYCCFHVLSKVWEGL